MTPFAITSMLRCRQVQPLTLNIKTDNYPEETTWIISDNLGNTLASGGPYTQATHLYTESIPLGFGTCYQFTIFDASGNGICCGTASGFGYYQLKSGNMTIRTGTDFGSKESTQFYSPSGVGMVENLNPFTLSVYPNPVSGLATIKFENTKPEIIEINVFNLQGSVARKFQAQEYPAGKNEIMLDCTHLVPGIYNIQLNAGDRIFNQKLTVK
ncbi:MAG: T9SS type A sorting domain-containing protein [Bacteroidales bacterium]|nr:T9SS type A sorting domain-containing protein [Bacteroidales bacterium]